MPTQQDAAGASNLNDVFVPRDVIDQIDEALAALYGLIQAAIDFIEEYPPPGSEATLITYGLVEYFFRLYNALNNARLLFSTAFDKDNAHRPFRHCHRRDGEETVLAEGVLA